MQLAAAPPEAVPARHSEHDDAPTSADVPAAHAVRTLEPSQEYPAGHGSQLVRVVLSPPDVYDPGGHVLQLLAPPPLYASSSPHAEHPLAPAAAKKPAPHSVLVLVPSGHSEPAGHSVQLVRVVLVPPNVNEPAGHSEQCSALFEL